MNNTSVNITSDRGKLDRFVVSYSGEELYSLTLGSFQDEHSKLHTVLAGRNALLVTTPSVWQLYGLMLMNVFERYTRTLSYVVLPLTERSKDINAVLQVCAAALHRNIDRKGLLIGLGGGVCTDITTVAASMIRRGIDHIRFPTTLVGQIDAGIGVKGAVNFGERKSFLGCFYPCRAVFIDPYFLATLPVAALRGGLAEIIKIAVVASPYLFSLIEANYQVLIAYRCQQSTKVVRQVLSTAISTMLSELETNLYERGGFKRSVDFGHSFSPAIETQSAYAISHGDAVSIDMALSCAIGVELGIVSEAICWRIWSLLRAVGLPLTASFLSVELCRASLEEVACHRGGQVNLVVPKGLGEAQFVEQLDDIDDETLRASLRRIEQLTADRTI